MTPNLSEVTSLGTVTMAFLCSRSCSGCRRLARCCCCSCRATANAAQRGWRWLVSARAAFAASLPLFPAVSIPAQPGFAAASSASTGSRRRGRISYGHRRHLGLWLVLLTTFLTPITILSTCDSVAMTARAAVRCLHAAAGNRHAGRVPGAGSVPVLHLLGIHAGPDVLPDRHLGQRQPGVRGGQVLPVYLGRLGADAAGDHRAVLRHARRRNSFSLPDMVAGRCATGNSRSIPTLQPLPVPGLLRGLCRSRCRCGRCIPGCPMRTPKRRRPARSSWPACC